MLTNILIGFFAGLAGFLIGAVLTKDATKVVVRVGKPSKWIPVEERLPEVRYVGEFADGHNYKSKSMLVTTINNLRAVAYYKTSNRGGYWWSEEPSGLKSNMLFVTAWMPIPEAYKEEE